MRSQLRLPVGPWMTAQLNERDKNGRVNFEYISCSFTLFIRAHSVRVPHLAELSACIEIVYAAVDAYLVPDDASVR